MRRHRSRLAVAPLITAASLLASTGAVAQRPRPEPLRRDACLDTISAAAMTRVMVYIHPRVVGDSSAAAINASGLFAQDAAAALRRMLGDTLAPVPRAEPRLGWRQVRGAMGVVLFRDGRLRVDGADSLDDAMSLLTRAVETLNPAAEADLVPADGPDSLRIAMTYEWPTVDHGGHVTTVEARPLIPAFTIAYPWREQVAPLDVVEPAYPDHPRSSNVEGTIMLEFVVDTGGHADPATMRDIWPADRPRPTGEAADWYRDFIIAVRESVAQSRYRPASIGGCHMRQLARQPFAFRLRH